MEGDRIGINIACGLPLNVFGYLILVAQTWTFKRQGYSWLSVLPLRSAAESLIPPPLPLRVRYFEEAWNAGSWGKFIEGKRHNDPTAPKLHDVAAFPNSPERCAQLTQSWLILSGASAVVHRIEDFRRLQEMGIPALLEISPGLWLTPEEILEELAPRTGERVLCLDFEHLLRDPRPDEREEHWRSFGTIAPQESLLGTRALNALLPWAGLIDPKPMKREEAFATFAGEETPLSKMINRVVESGYNGDWRVEFNLGLLGQSRAVSFAGRFYTYLAQKV